MTRFDELVAASIRVMHLPFDTAILLWHIASIFVLLLACRQLARLCFDDPRAEWGAVLVVASLLTLPVAGTALLVMDQYLTTRSFSTPGVMFMVVCAVQKKYLRAALWAVFTALIHPLMVVFGLAYLFFAYVFIRRVQGFAGLSRSAYGGRMALLPIGLLFQPASETYWKALNTRSYFFILRWEWYEWLGIFGPLALLWLLARFARNRRLPLLEALSQALVAFGLFFFVVALIITIPRRFAGLTLLQPMRSLHLLYIMLLVFGGALLGKYVLQRHALRWLLVLIPLCGVMGYASRQEFPATPHLELPGARPANSWLQAFEWIRLNTPVDAVFALDPEHMQLPGVDQHGFRVLAERSMLADAIKDSGVVTMFPAMAEEWQRQVTAQSGWRHFQVADFQRLRQRYGVGWVLLQQPGVSGMDCPYRNQALIVCRVP